MENRERRTENSQFPILRSPFFILHLPVAHCLLLRVRFTFRATPEAWYDTAMTPGHSTPWPRWSRNVALMLVLLGMAWRLLRYLLQFPIWGDEAFVCLNFLDRDYLGLMKPLRYVQVAPILFLWSERTAYRLLGGSELALR